MTKLVINFLDIPKQQICMKHPYRGLYEHILSSSLHAQEWFMAHVTDSPTGSSCVISGYCVRSVCGLKCRRLMCSWFNPAVIPLSLLSCTLLSELLSDMFTLRNIQK